MSLIDYKKWRTIIRKKYSTWMNRFKHLEMNMMKWKLWDTRNFKIYKMKIKILKIIFINLTMIRPNYNNKFKKLIDRLLIYNRNMMKLIKKKHRLSRGYKNTWQVRWPHLRFKRRNKRDLNKKLKNTKIKIKI